MKHNKQSNKKDASALVTVILTIAILSVLAGAFVSTVNNRRLTVSQASAWQEALIAAEAGAHEGIARVEQSLVQNGQGLLPANIDNVEVTLDHKGEGTTTASARYSLKKGNIPDYPGYYRIVSTGKVDLPGGQFLSMDGRDAVVRKLNLQDTVSGAPLRTATRTVEAWLQPVYSGTGSAGLRTEGRILMNTFQIFIDSFDSTDPTRSFGGLGLPYPTDNKGTDAGYYNVAPYNILAANISTNSDSLNLGNARIYGDAYTHGGTQETVLGEKNVKGNLYDDYYEPMAPVYAPQWTLGTYTSGMLVPKPSGKGSTLATTVKTSPVAPIQGGTKLNPTRIVVDSITLAGTGDNITFAPGTIDPDGKSYVELYVKQTFTTKGGGSPEDGAVTILKGVNVTMYVAGNLDFTGNGLVNKNNTAASLSIQGINPTPPTSQTPSFTLAGSSKFYGTVYAPGFDLKLAGGGNGEFVGSLAGKTAELKGTTQIRYDESLGQSQQDIITSFKLASWFEDTRSWPVSGDFKKANDWLRPF